MDYPLFDPRAQRAIENAQRVLNSPGFRNAQRVIDRVEHGFARHQHAIDRVERGFARHQHAIDRIGRGFAAHQRAIDRVERGFSRHQRAIEQWGRVALPLLPLLELVPPGSSVASPKSDLPQWVADAPESVFRVWLEGHL